MMRALLRFAVLMTICLAAWAQDDYPNRPVRIIVPFAPGGSTDVVARILADKLGTELKQNFIVENKPGAGGNIGADAVAKASPDGYTLLMGTTGVLAINKYLYKNMSFDPDRDLAPVSYTSLITNILVVNPQVPARTVPELLALAKADPGKLTFASSGAGSSTHLSAELFKSMAKIDLLHVPYKGTGQATADLLAGQIDLLFAPAQAVLSHVKAGKLKALATTGAKRPETIPDLPTVAESGLPGYEAVGWFGLLAPAATPKSTVEKLSADANRVLADQEIRTRMQAVGADPSGNTPEEFARFIRDDQAKWAKLMREAGIKPE